MADILGIHEGVSFDESISNYEVHAHQPYTSNFENSDEIRISIQNQDLSLLPSQSMIRVYGRLTTADGKQTKKSSFVNCAICHLFEDI